MFSLQPNGIAMPSVNELIAYYKRQKLELRDNGMRLIRPIARPDYMVNNDEVSTMEVLGQVIQTSTKLNSSCKFCILRAISVELFAVNIVVKR